MKLFNTFVMMGLSLLFIHSLDAQIHVDGNVTDQNLDPVEDALVTFIDESDTTCSYCSLTDNQGEYNVEILI
jgi:hypothetical protein